MLLTLATGVTQRQSLDDGGVFLGTFQKLLKRQLLVAILCEQRREKLNGWLAVDNFVGK